MIKSEQGIMAVVPLLWVPLRRVSAFTFEVSGWDEVASTARPDRDFMLTAVEGMVMFIQEWLPGEFWGVPLMPLPSGDHGPAYHPLTGYAPAGPAADALVDVVKDARREDAELTARERERLALVDAVRDARRAELHLDSASATEARQERGPGLAAAATKFGGAA